MIFFIACILLLAGIILLFTTLKAWRNPRVDASVVEIIEEEKNWWSKTSSKIVTVTFDYRGERFENKKTYLIAQDVKINQLVVLSLNPKNPKDFKPFYPKLELLAVVLIFGLSSILLWLCFWVMDWLEK